MEIILRILHKEALRLSLLITAYRFSACSDKHYFIEKKCRIRVGAMIFVVVEDLIPDAHLSEHPHFGTWGAMPGFAMMMALDVALG